MGIDDRGKGCVCLCDDFMVVYDMICFFFFFQAEDGIRDVERSRGLGDVYKRQFTTTGVSRWSHTVSVSTRNWSCYVKRV